MSNQARGFGVRHYQVLVVLLFLICVGLLIGLIVVSGGSGTTEEAATCGGSQSGTINLDPPSSPSPFHDLTPGEILNIKNFLYSKNELKLVRPQKIKTNTSYIFTMEINIPDKTKVLDFLDRSRAQPEREALVYLFRGDLADPMVQECLVGPLPKPRYMKNCKDVPYRYRAVNGPENEASNVYLVEKVHSTVADILKESYGGSLKDCGDQCLAFQFTTPVSANSIGEPGTRKMWYWLSRELEFHTLENLDFMVLVDLTSSDPAQYKIDKVVYANQEFDTLEELSQAYKTTISMKTKARFLNENKQLFSSLNRRGTLFPEKPTPPPEQFMPGEHRYSINGRHIDYMGWAMDVRMSTISGPQLYDIRYQDKRLVYELSLQELSAIYSAHNPAHRYATFADSVFLIGSRARGLVPGTDCPRHATYMSATHSFEHSDPSVVYPTAFCVFEHNTAMPLRRHLAFESVERQFYEGMVDTVLVVRTIATVINYDYIFDFIFHQNGAIEVKSTSNGFILSSFWSQKEDEYGFRLGEQLVGNMHHHMFHFKVDMDINGRENRFEVLEVKPVSTDSRAFTKSTIHPNYEQTKMVKTEITSERKAALKYSFDSPKYLTFYNNQYKTKYGVPRAYRLYVKGMSKQLFPENMGSERSFSWGRYQVAVTKHKESERRSSSMYACWDAEDPIVHFQSFIDDDESISDQDQVAWVTVGIHHIPHTEDLPVTPTVGLALEFFILPYNYYNEDPAMGSSDAVRIEPDRRAAAQRVDLERYGKSSDITCKPRKPSFMSKSYDDAVSDAPDMLFNQA